MDKKKKLKQDSFVLVVMDGWGIDDSWGGNAITVADTPNFDAMWAKYPHTQLKASGEAVGVSIGETGSSEVGHMNIGAGYIVKQQLPLINEAIESGKFLQNPTLKKISKWVKDNQSVLHIMGLVSDGGVHSYLNHLLSLIEFCKSEEIREVKLHIFTDGRDADIHSAQKYIDQISHQIKDSPAIEIASVSGRYYPMDRDKHWERTKIAYDLLARGIGKSANNPNDVIIDSYSNGLTDEFIIPTIIKKNFKKIEDNDAIICINYRADRVRQLLGAFCIKDFNNFEVRSYKNLLVAGFVQYSQTIPAEAIFPIVSVKDPIAKVISDNNLTQLHIAETEKYPHVTYFFNGGIEDSFEGEDRAVIQSPKVATYDLEPQMSAEKITQELIKKFRGKKYDFIIVNYANTDMVGHSGNFVATVKAVEVVDEQLGKLKKFFVDNIGANLLITADHGNAEVEINSISGYEDTEHSLNPVPCILVSNKFQNKQLRGECTLSSIAPTILKMMELKIPSSMHSPNLIID